MKRELAELQQLQQAGMEASEALARRRAEAEAASSSKEPALPKRPPSPLLHEREMKKDLKEAAKPAKEEGIKEEEPMEREEPTMLVKTKGVKEEPSPVGSVKRELEEREEQTALEALVRIQRGKRARRCSVPEVKPPAFPDTELDWEEVLRAWYQEEHAQTAPEEAEEEEPVAATPGEEVLSVPSSEDEKQSPGPSPPVPTMAPHLRGT